MHRDNFDWVRELQNVSARLVNIVTDAGGPRSSEKNPSGALFAYDVISTPEQVLVEIELPGVVKDDISLTMGGEKVSLTCERRENDVENGTVFRRTRRYGSLSAQFELPRDIEMDYSQAVAAFKDGVLTITIPRKRPQPGISVPIQ